MDETDGDKFRFVIIAFNLFFDLYYLMVLMIINTAINTFKWKKRQEHKAHLLFTTQPSAPSLFDPQVPNLSSQSLFLSTMSCVPLPLTLPHLPPHCSSPHLTSSPPQALPHWPTSSPLPELPDGGRGRG